MTEIPGWLATALAALIGFVGAWAALRVTVAGLKDDVLQLKSLVLTVTTLQAQQKTTEIELDRVRESGHQTRNRLQELSERVARLEAKETI